MVADVEQFFESIRGSDSPWSDAHLFTSRIRRNVKLAECPSYGLTIFDYVASSHGAEDYAALAEEFLALYASMQSATNLSVCETPETYISEESAASPVETEVKPVESESSVSPVSPDSACPAEKLSHDT